MRLIHLMLAGLVVLLGGSWANATPTLTVLVDDCYVAAVADGWVPFPEPGYPVWAGDSDSGPIFGGPQWRFLDADAMAGFTHAGAFCTWNPAGTISVETMASPGAYFADAHAHIHWLVAVGDEPFDLWIGTDPHSSAGIQDVATMQEWYFSAGQTGTVTLDPLHTYDLMLASFATGGSSGWGSITFNGDVLPEPATLALLALGGLAALARRRRR